MAETLAAVWSVFDADGDGTIDRGEFAMPGGLGETLAASLGAPPPRPSPPHVLSATIVGHAAPRPLQATVVAHAGAAPPSYLGPGWEECRTPDGQVYYTNHHTRTTQWERPT